MNHRIPIRWLIALLAAAGVAAVSFVVLNRSFGGPGSQVGASGYEVNTRLSDAQYLLPKSLVLVNGVKVGEVVRIETDQGASDVTLRIDSRHGGVGEGASASVGWRTAFGEAYVRLDRGDRSGRTLASGSSIPGRENVETDEALSVLDPATRKRVRSVIGSLGDATEDPQRAGQIRTALTGLSATTGSLRRLTGALEGQSDDLASLIENSGVVAGKLAARERSLDQIVSAGNRTMRALSASGTELQDGVAELPRFTAAADRTLRELPTVLTPAKQVTGDITAAVRALRPAMQQAGPAIASTRSLSDRIPPLTKAASPVLEESAPVVKGLEGTGRNMEPNLRNLIPLGRWLRPRAASYASAFALLGASTRHSDSDGNFWHVFLLTDELGSAGNDMRVNCGTNKKFGSCFNPYPVAGEAERPYRAGDYERILPYPKP